MQIREKINKRFQIWGKKERFYEREGKKKKKFGKKQKTRKRAKCEYKHNNEKKLGFPWETVSGAAKN